MKSILPAYYGLASPSGFLDRPVESSRWEVPDVVMTDVRERYLYFEAEFLPFGADSMALPEFRNMAGPARGMLEKFVTLERAPAEKIRAFASKWGLLGARREGRFWVVGYETRPNPHAFLNVGKWLPNQKVFSGFEPIAYWRYWASRFAAALRVGTRLREGGVPDRADWERMHDVYPALLKVRSKPKSEGAKLLKAWVAGDYECAQDALKSNSWQLARDTGTGGEKDRDRKLLNAWWLWRNVLPRYFSAEQAFVHSSLRLQSWQELAGLRLCMRLYEAKLEIGTQTLFAGLVWQLMNAFSTSSGISICSECGATFAPKRKPAPNVRHFCPQCRKAGVPVKRAVQDLRLRRKAALQKARNRKGSKS